MGISAPESPEVRLHLRWEQVLPLLFRLQYLLTGAGDQTLVQTESLSLGELLGLVVSQQSSLDLQGIEVGTERARQYQHSYHIVVFHSALIEDRSGSRRELNSIDGAIYFLGG